MPDLRILVASLRHGQWSKYPAAIKCWTLTASHSPTCMGVRHALMLTPANVLTMDEARRIASNIAKLPNYIAANPEVHD
jgi:hypothetical protein